MVKTSNNVYHRSSKLTTTFQQQYILVQFIISAGYINRRWVYTAFLRPCLDVTFY
jgi:hypothetical protein